MNLPTENWTSCCGSHSRDSMETNSDQEEKE